MKKELRVRVKFFSKYDGGRTELPKDLLSSGNYRPHFVVGSPDQKQAIADENNVGLEDYLGVVFIKSRGSLMAEQELEASVSLLYPGVDYSALKKEATFTIREGGKIVGNGKII